MILVLHDSNIQHIWSEFTSSILADKFGSNCHARGSSRLHVVLPGKGHLSEIKCHYGWGAGRLVGRVLLIIQDNSTWLEYFLDLVCCSVGMLLKMKLILGKTALVYLSKCLSKSFL
jgi:hypothetical protein